MLDSPYISGHGLGGMIAAEMASLAPQRIAKLVLIAPYGLRLADAPPADISALSPDELARAVWHDRATAPRLGAPQDRSRHAQNLAAAARFTSLIPEKGLRKRLHRLLPPTLLVWGEHDRIVPLAYAEASRRRIAHSQLLVIPAAAHLPHLEQPRTFARSVLEFLDG